MSTNADVCNFTFSSFRVRNEYWWEEAADMEVRSHCREIYDTNIKFSFEN